MNWFNAVGLLVLGAIQFGESGRFSYMLLATLGAIGWVLAELEARKQ